MSPYLHTYLFWILHIDDLFIHGCIIKIVTVLWKLLDLHHFLTTIGFYYPPNLKVDTSSFQMVYAKCLYLSGPLNSLNMALFENGQPTTMKGVHNCTK